MSRLLFSFFFVDTVPIRRLLQEQGRQPENFTGTRSSACWVDAHGGSVVTLSDEFSFNSTAGESVGRDLVDAIHTVMHTIIHTQSM